MWSSCWQIQLKSFQHHMQTRILHQRRGEERGMCCVGMDHGSFGCRDGKGPAGWQQSEEIWYHFYGLWKLMLALWLFFFFLTGCMELWWGKTVWAEAVWGYEKLWEVLEAVRSFQAFLPSPVALLPLHSFELLSMVFSPFSHTPLLTGGLNSLPPSPASNSANSAPMAAAESSGGDRLGLAVGKCCPDSSSLPGHWSSLMYSTLPWLLVDHVLHKTCHRRPSSPSAPRVFPHHKCHIF